MDWSERAVYGYTLSDSANARVFREAFDYIINVLKYSKHGNELHDVDGSVIQVFKKQKNQIKLESNVQIDYVGLESTEKLNIECIREWNDN